MTTDSPRTCLKPVMNCISLGVFLFGLRTNHYHPRSYHFKGFPARYRAEKQDKYARTHHFPGVQEPEPLPDERHDLSPIKTHHHSVAGSSNQHQPDGSTGSISCPGSDKDESGPTVDSVIQPHVLYSSSVPIIKRSLVPHLQFMCGPMLRYDNVDLASCCWLGFCCIVTADAGSVYEPTPMLQMRWTPHFSSSESSLHDEMRQEVNAQRIFVYQGSSDTYSFWRFRLVIPMCSLECRVIYSINHGAEIAFCIPAIGQNLRWAGHSCNGFSAGVDQASFNGPDPVWTDLLNRHKVHPFHVLIGGGDQLYCDAIAKEPELADWLTEKDQIKKKEAPLTDSIQTALDRFFFSHYCRWFRSGAFGKAISCIPMINMLDDHDIIDGFGSYPADLQTSPIFSAIGTRGYFWYLLFQLFIVDHTDKIDDKSPRTSKIHSSLILGGPGPYIPFRNHSFLCYLGPQVWIMLLDCRAERMKERVCSPETYQGVFEECKRLPDSVTHLIFLLGIPIVYPRMVFAERLLEKRDSLIFKTMSRMGILPGFYNNFNADPELLDDMNDHWCAQSHKKERNWFIIECQKLALLRKLRITYLSGDVHCAAVGRLYTQDSPLKPECDPKYMLNVISSAIVNTPPPPALIGVMGRLSKVCHKTLLHVRTAEDMVEAFKFDTNGNKLNNPRFMGRRNYCAVRFVNETGEVEFNIRVEIEQGVGTTKGYPILVPPPNYQ